jgi:hypothetical protein
MREGMRFIRWRGEEFRFERLEGRRDLTPRSPVWAVSRGREFVGTMSYADAETVRELDVRCVRWLAALLG